MVEEHRGPSPYDSLLDPIFDDEGHGGWMISYMDVMTLLVALFVLIITAYGIVNPPQETPSDAPTNSASVPLRMGVPLPPSMTALASRPVTTSASTLLPQAVTAAIGVAGLPRPPTEVAQRVPLPRPPVALEAVSSTIRSSESSPLKIALPSGVETDKPLRDYLLVLTDSLPVNAVEARGDSLASLPFDHATLEQEAGESATELPDLEGVAATRVPEGIRLRVEDQLLFDTAQADLTEIGGELVTGLMELIQRHDGVVSVEGHSDDRPIQTPEFASNWALSSARAIAIVHALEEAGVATSRLRAVGLADTQPLSRNDSATGRAMNRRVEVVIYAE